jgi:hypothetical protein
LTFSRFSAKIGIVSEQKEPESKLPALCSGFGKEAGTKENGRRGRAGREG